MPGHDLRPATMKFQSMQPQYQVALAILGNRGFPLMESGLDFCSLFSAGPLVIKGASSFS